jgi:mono/diheme cytochrome c family protein
MSSDNDPKTPVEIAVTRRRCWWMLLLLILLLGAGYYFLFVNQYVVAFDDDGHHFMHGSIGSETATGPPYWVFKALPVMYAGKLGSEGYGRFGFLYEKPNDDLPIGVSRRVVSGVDRVWLNCAVCHVGTYHLPADGERHLILGAPSNMLRLQDFILFLIDVGRDPGFNADSLIATIDSKEVGGNLNVVERLIYRYIVFPRVKNAFLDLGTRLAFVSRQEGWGPGRVDTFNPYKALQFNFPMAEENISGAVLNSSSDFPAIWQQRPREGMNLHWDGNNDSVAERNLSAALGAGVTPVTVDRASIGRIENWLWDLPAPKFPAEDKIDKGKLAVGTALFLHYCSECHGFRGDDGYDYNTNRYPELGRVVPLKEIGTDAGRWASYTQNFAAEQNLLYAGYPFRFSRFKKTDGYANHPLDGIWARSPYLHNGSVPTLRDLLEPTSRRPSVWYRGSDELDLAKVGYRSDGAAPGGNLFRYDTTRPGNANTGHEGARYGTDLPASDKDALVEYMKTL